jgi:hypothetical protein
MTPDREPPALRSTPNRMRTAVRRDAAWPPAERPSSCPQCSRQSRALAGGLTAEPSWLPNAAGAAHHNTVWRTSSVVLPRMSIARWSPCPRPPSTRPPSGACPASTCPGPRVRCPMPGVQCPVSSARVDVGCPVSGAASGIRACSVCVHSVRAGEFLECEGAVGSHASGPAGVGVSPTMSATGSSGAQRDLNLGPAQSGIIKT